MNLLQAIATAAMTGLIVAIWVGILVGPIALIAFRISSPYIAVPLSFMWVAFWIAFTSVVIDEL